MSPIHILDSAKLRFRPKSSDPSILIVEDEYLLWTRSEVWWHMGTGARGCPANTLVHHILMQRDMDRLVRSA